MKVNLKDYGLCDVVKNEYPNGNLALSLKDEYGSPIANISTNIIPLFDNQFALDVNNLSLIVDEVIASGFFKDTGDVVHSGFVEYPIYELV